MNVINELRSYIDVGNFIEILNEFVNILEDGFIVKVVKINIHAVKIKTEKSKQRSSDFRAENGTRTRDPNLGKVVLYQLSYFRKILSKRSISLDCGCKGNAFFGTDKTFHRFFSKNFFSDSFYRLFIPYIPYYILNFTNLSIQQRIKTNYTDYMDYNGLVFVARVGAK